MKEKARVSIIAAIDEERGIGKQNKLLWHIQGDLRHFHQTTKGKTVIIGRKTYESIGHPLRERNNIVITRNKNFRLPENVYKAESLDDALEIAFRIEPKEVFIIGGGELYREGIKYAERLYITKIAGRYGADTFFPQYEADFPVVISKKDSSGNGYTYTFFIFEKMNSA